LYKFIFEWPEVQTAPGKGNNRRQWISKYANHTIPLPPVHVQEKIVSILDTFTELTKELTKEQEARQTQYEYYRDKLLTFEDGEVEWKTLDECFEIIAGGDVPREALSETYAEEFPVPVLSNGIEENSIYGWTNRARITEPSL